MSPCRRSAAENTPETESREPFPAEKATKSYEGGKKEEAGGKKDFSAPAAYRNDGCLFLACFFSCFNRFFNSSAGEESVYRF